MALRVRRRDGIATGSRHGWLLATLAVLAVAVLLPLATFLVSSWLRGWQLQAVQSGSMQPTYPVGSLLVVDPIDASEVRPGMAVTFIDPEHRGRMVTHRVVGRALGQALQFWTQGDANATRDRAPVPARYIRGKVKWQVTHLGSLLTWLRWPRSFLIFVVAPVALLIATEWRGRRSMKKKAEFEPKEGADDAIVA